MTSILFGIVRICRPDSNTIIFKTKNFINSFVPFLESTSYFKHFEKKDDCHSYFIPEITDCQRLGLTTL